MSRQPSSQEKNHAFPQLPVESYFGDTIYQREMEHIFQKTPRYIGHTQLVPEIGDYYALPQENDGRALIHTTQGIELLSNVCRHRQAIILQGKGNTGGHIVCPLHRWTYKNTGEQIAAPHFPQNPCLHLQRYPLTEWNGLLFETQGCAPQTDLQHLNSQDTFNFSGYKLGHVEQHLCAYNWKTFIEVYLEDYHVAPFHPGLGHFVNCDNLTWEFTNSSSVQRVGIKDHLKNPGSPAYNHWQKEIQNYRKNTSLSEELPFGAIWLLYYPTLMIECYPHVLIISNMWPMGPQKTLNTIEFYYPEEIAAFETDLMQAQRAAYMETCHEDDTIALRMDQGRQALMHRQTRETGPYQNPMEEGMKQFHLWYRKMMPKD